MSAAPIADYALLSDCHSAALVSRAGSVDWLCFPRFDAASVCGRLLDAGAGHWAIAPRDINRVTRRYVERSLVMETTFETATGTAVVTDGLALGRRTRGHDLGEGAPHALLRRVRCTHGHVSLETEFAPRPEYGLVAPLLSLEAEGVSGRGGPDVLALSAAVPFAIADSTARGTWTMSAGDDTAFALQWASSTHDAPAFWSQRQIRRRLDDTIRAWHSWSDLHQRFTGPWADLVSHSGRVLQGLTFYPTGAMVAAASTSLPEQIGGARNWDYRYTWIRDASFTLQALWIAACPDEAHRFFHFLTAAALTPIRRGADLQIMYRIAGEHDLAEREIPGMAGWRGSRPVRIGNGAWNQRQLDVYGELLDAVYTLREQLTQLAPVTREFLVGLADAAARRWTEPDHGIWEIRGEPRHFVYSKMMCWLALDRAIALAPILGAEQRVEAWCAARDDIRQAILKQGWDARVGAFVQAFGSDALDASALMMPIVGFLPADDPRILQTIDAIATRLTDHRGLVFRYRVDDGLAGDEGTFLLCTFWLAHAQALAGRLSHARATFGAAAAFVNDVGLLSEQVDPSTGELLGNFPQAFSHIGLINAAWAIARAEQDAAGEEHRTA